MYVPAMIKILSVFVGILLLSRAKLPLGVGLMLGGLSLSLWAGMGWAGTLRHFTQAWAAPELWLLLVVTALILDMGRYVATEKNAAALMAWARRWGGQHGRAASLMAIPALIGLVPMPGGALVSAPLVKQTVADQSWAAEWKVTVNYWFRHTWEYWWPLFPVVIITLSIFDIPTWQFMLVQIPFSVMALASGYLFLIRPHVDELKRPQADACGAERGVGRVVLPLMIVVVSVITLPFLLERVMPAAGSQVHKLLAMLIGVLLGLLLIFCEEGGALRGYLRATLTDRKTVNIVVTVAGVLVFQHMLEASNLLPDAGAELLRTGIPLVYVVALLPFVAGLVTGIAMGFAGTAFPLVVGFTAMEGGGLTTLSALVLAFGFGYAGMMLSPVHLCLVLTRDYFDAPFRGIYGQLRSCLVVLLVWSVVLYVGLARFGL